MRVFKVKQVYHPCIGKELADMVFTFSHPSCLISFCERCQDPIYLDEVIRESKASGICRLFLLSLSSQRYIDVYKGLWCMDKKRRLKVLREYEDRLHAPLMYEQAIAEFACFPTLKTLKNISIPLVKAASFRLLQDAKCSRDPSVCTSDFDKRMEKVFFDRLNALTQAHLQKSLQEIMQEESAGIEKKSVEKVLQVARRALFQSLPSPHWIGVSGFAVLVDDRLPSFRQASECQSIREIFAYETILEHESSFPSEADAEEEKVFGLTAI